MTEHFTFSDVLIEPQFSEIASREDVDTWQDFGGSSLRLPIISSNMDTVTGVEMAKAMRHNGAIGALHRFWSIGDNLKAFQEAHVPVIISIGLGDSELTRAETLYQQGAAYFCIDVAHGASMQVVKQANALKKMMPDIILIVGNFATGKSINEFESRMNEGNVDYYKVGIGPGSACTTRVKTGVGVPQLSAIMDCASTGYKIIADGGMRTPGDIAKALGAGAEFVMLGGMLAGTDETPGTIDKHGHSPSMWYKTYRGSASKESYEVQGKDDYWRTAEGESFLVPCKGPVKNVLQDIEGGLRSALSYVGAKDLKEFREKCKFIKVSNNSQIESGAHGKKE